MQSGLTELGDEAGLSASAVTKHPQIFDKGLFHLTYIYINYNNNIICISLFISGLGTVIMFQHFFCQGASSPPFIGDRGAGTACQQSMDGLHVRSGTVLHQTNRPHGCTVLGNKKWNLVRGQMRHSNWFLQPCGVHTSKEVMNSAPIMQDLSMNYPAKFPCLAAFRFCILPVFTLPPAFRLLQVEPPVPPNKTDFAL